MLDAGLLGYLLKVAFDGIVGAQASQAPLFQGSKKAITKR